MLRNVRDEQGEMDKMSMDQHAQSKLVRELSALADIYVSDAFGAAHRSQCSLVGFQAVLPSAAGRLMEKELEALSQVIRRAIPPLRVRTGRLQVLRRHQGGRPGPGQEHSRQDLVGGIGGQRLPEGPRRGPGTEEREDTHGGVHRGEPAHGQGDPGHVRRSHRDCRWTWPWTTEACARTCR